VDLSNVLRVFHEINIDYFILTVLVFFLDRLFMAYKWNLLTKAKDVTISVWQSFRIYLISTFFGVFLPTGIGGDIYRIYYTSKRTGRTEEITASVVLERSIGIVASAVFATFGLTLMLESSPERVLGVGILGIYVSVLCFLILSVIALWMSIQDGSLRIVGLGRDRWGNSWLFKKWIRCHESYVQFRRHKRILVIFFLLSVARQSIFVFGNYFAAKSLGLNIGLIYFMGIIPIIHILMRIPISINAIGVQEGAYALLFTGLGISITEAFALAIVVRMARWVVLLPGGVLYVTDGWTVKKEIEGQCVMEKSQEMARFQEM
jgi:uncharacterized protein (TIRG00374 family)